MLVRLEGADRVLKMLQNLPDAVLKQGGNAIRFGLRKGIKVIHDAALQNLDAIIAENNKDGVFVSTGRLRASIVIRRSRMAPGIKGDSYIVRISNKSYPDEEYVSTAQVARLLEYGTATRQPMPFIRPAYESRKVESAQLAVTTIEARLQRVLDKLTA
jgi:HK97 gp10 family phage protein